MQRLKHSVLLLLGFIILFSSCTQKTGVSWEKYEPEKLVAAQLSKMPVVLDFYADWCIPCKELEHYTYTNPEVIKAFDGFRRFKIDIDRADEKGVSELVSHFNVEGVPTVIFLDADGKEVPNTRIEGFVPPTQMIALLHSIQMMRGEPEPQQEP